MPLHATHTPSNKYLYEHSHASSVYENKFSSFLEFSSLRRRSNLRMECFSPAYSEFCAKHESFPLTQANIISLENTRSWKNPLRQFSSPNHAHAHNKTSLIDRHTNFPEKKRKLLLSLCDFFSHFSA